MAVTVTMPQLGETVTEGTILSWAKQPGDMVEEDEVLLEISTDKVDTEVPSPAAGVLQEILVAEGETVSVGTPLAVLAEQGEAAAAAAPAVVEPEPISAPEPVVTLEAATPPSPPEPVEAPAPPVVEPVATPASTPEPVPRSLPQRRPPLSRPSRYRGPCRSGGSVDLLGAILRFRGAAPQRPLAGCPPVGGRARRRPRSSARHR